MGSVYLAEDSDGNQLALKLLKSDLFDDPKAVHRFQREAKLGASLDAPGIVKTRDAGRDETTGVFWIALDYVDGATLTLWSELRGPPEPAVATRLITQLLGAVAAAHERGIIHRDLKPENVLVTDDPDGPNIHVLDFGIAKSSDSSTVLSTRAGLGSPAWTAPEQARHGYVPAPTNDVWALGLLAFFIVTGRIYWVHAHAKRLAELAVELYESEIVPPAVRCKELGIDAEFPPGFSDWFARCVVRDAQERFATAGDALAALTSRRPGHRTHGDAPPSTVPAALVLAIAYAGVVLFGLALYLILAALV